MGDGFGDLFSSSFDVFFAIVLAIIAVVFVVVIVTLVRQTVGVHRQRSENAASPEVQAQARVVDKRVESLAPGNADAAALASPNIVRVPMGDTSVYQLHRITFEQAGGARFELSVPPDQYGLIVEGDSGTVTMKGSELLGFQRELMR